MKFASKILAVAVAAVAFTGSAHASLAPPSSGNGTFALYVWDTNPAAAVPNQAYALDTGLTLTSILSLATSTTINLGGSSIFQGLFSAADIAGGFVDFTLLAGNDKASNPILVSGGTGTPAWIPGQTAVGAVGGWLDLAATNLISATTEYSISALTQGNGNFLLGSNLVGQTSTQNSAGILGSGGTTLSLFESVSVPNGGTARAPILNPAAVTPLGLTATLLADGELDITKPSVVPLPAAAWLLGSGLLGLVGVGRRRRNA